MRILFFIIILLVSGSIVNAQKAHLTNLEIGFKNPPASAKPRTWYHVMSGNMSKEGITKDLEAMHEAGIGGLILFNVTHTIPKGNIKFNSPEHIEMIAHAAAESERLGMSFGIHNCDGWRNSGGPWVPVEHSMKQVVHTEMVVDGGEVDIQLPQPTSREGFYQDIAVVAYPALKSEIDDAVFQPVLTSSDSACNVKLVNDGRDDKSTKLSGSVKKRAWVQFDYGKPKTIRSVYINLNKRIADKGRTWLLTSNDGKNFETLSELKILRMGKTENGFDDVFEPITARYFRVETEGDFDLAEINLSNTRRFENMLARTSLFQREDAQLPAIKQPDESMVIKKENIIDLTSKLDGAGKLTTRLSPGKWTIMRFGFTSTGATNGPASPEGTGLEVDKMSKESFRIFYEGYVRNVIDAAKKVAPNALQCIEIDSYEVGGQNWTKDYEKKFSEKNSYDLIKFLPVYAGRFIECAKVTNDVLWDIRNFNSDLITENYFGYFNELCHEDGLISYAEPYSFNGPFNELDAAGKVDIPMGEFWMHQRFQTETAVSGARIYGKPIVSAEAFSAQSDINWRSHPGFMKLTGDKAWTLGINEFMFHRFAHQANTKVKPGMTMSQWGSHIDRTQTWWENAGLAWFEYLARGQYLLRQGKPVPDLLVFVGDGSPNSIVQRAAFNPSIPNSINYDCINSDALINRISAKNGKLVLPDGIQYNVLVLFNTKNIRYETIQKINDLAEKGVVIVGEKPEEIGGYKISREQKTEFDKLVQNIWSKSTTYTNYNWQEILEKNIIPIDLKIGNRTDINYIHRKSGIEDIYFFYNPDSVTQTFDCRFNVAGKIPELWNQINGEITQLALFTKGGGFTTVPITLPPEGSVFVVFRKPVGNFDPVNQITSGDNAKPKLVIDTGGQLEIIATENGLYSLDFESGKKQNIQIEGIPVPLKIDGAWNVKFQNYGFDTTIVFNELNDWRDSDVEEVKYYSGTAVYKTKFKIIETQLERDEKLMLNLGKVAVAARVLVNNREVAVLWENPYSIDISDFVKPGENELKVEITNTWTNRLIGDENYSNTSGYELNMEKMPEWYINNQEPDLGDRKAFCVYPFYQKGDVLEKSGLTGPVTISFIKKRIINSN
jgi:hypothetical protein